MLAVVLCSCGRQGAKLLPVGEGRLAVNGGNIWFKISGNTRGIPVVLLHGGPGFSSFYMKPFDDLADSRQVIRYDQLGSGKSDKTTDTSIFTIEHFVREMDSLRSYLGIERWHILGHSWGTMLAVEYYRLYPEHVASLTLCSASLDIPAWERNARELVKTLSDSSQRAIHAAEASNRFDDSSYQNAIAEFYGKYVYRHPVQADLDSTLSTMNEVLYNYMQGPSEFTISGTIRNYDATPYLHEIKVPVLYTVGEFDEAGPQLIQRFASLTPGAKMVTLKGAAHITPWDAHDENVRVVRDFLMEVDSASATVKP